MEIRNKIKVELPKKRIKLCTLNPHIVCLLCAGYFVEATTIVECLHTFCKSCIVRYLQSSKLCPTCGTVVHETEPLSNIKRDNTMQDIMDKILPGIRAKEKKSEEEFMAGIRKKEAENKANNEQLVKPQVDLSNFPNNYRYNEQFNLCLELDCNSETALDEMEVEELHNKYIRCPGRTRSLHLKKLIRKFYEPCCAQYELKMKCNDHEVDDDDHVRLIYIKYWKRKPQPITLYYGFRKLSEDVSMVLDDCISNIESGEGKHLKNLKNRKKKKLDEPLSSRRRNSDGQTRDELYDEANSNVREHDETTPLHVKLNVENENRSPCKVSANDSKSSEMVEHTNRTSFTCSPVGVTIKHSGSKGPTTSGLNVYKKMELTSPSKLTVSSLERSFNNRRIVHKSFIYAPNHACLTVT